ncbi:MAG: AMP-binding protein [Solirubrobacterales bacterium]|nr:AMP-binding protein [Solirubrobacterales bacterium]
MTAIEARIHRSPFPAPVAPVSPVVALLRDAAADPESLAIVDGASGVAPSRRRVAEWSAAIAAGLAERGVERGEPVALAMPNLPGWPVIALGIWRAGAAVCALSPFWGAEETARLLALVSPRIAIASPEVAEVMRDAAAIAGLGTEVAVAEEAPGDAPVPDLAADDGDAPTAPRLAPDDLAAIVFSSGTSGPFKGVRLTVRNLAASAAQVATSFALDGGYDGDSVALAGAPFFASMGLGAALCAPLSVGAPIVTVPVPQTEALLAAAAAHRATHAVVPLTVLEEVASAAAAPAHDLSSLRLLATGGAHVPPAVELVASERVGCPARDGYGMTEATSMISGPLGRPNDPDTVGWLAAGTQARIVDQESGRDVEAGTAGEVWIRGPQVMEGYHGDVQATAATLTADGWLRTGDLGRMLEDGQLVLVDRLKELIKVRGAQVAPAEVELVLREHPAVRDAAVVGRPDPARGEVPVAHVVPAGNASPKELAEYVASRLARHKRLHDVRIVESLPRAPSGKLLRYLIRDRERDAARRASGAAQRT